MNRSESRDIGCFMSAISRVFCEMYFFNKNNSIKIFLFTYNVSIFAANFNI